MEFAIAVLGLFDRILVAMMGVPILMLLLSFFVFAVVLGTFLMVKSGGRGGRR